jgi:hypothetical protein
LPGLGSNCNPPDLSLPSSYSCEPQGWLTCRFEVTPVAFPEFFRTPS